MDVTLENLASCEFDSFRLLCAGRADAQTTSASATMVFDLGNSYVAIMSPKGEAEIGGELERNINAPFLLIRSLITVIGWCKLTDTNTQEYTYIC